MRVLLSVVPYLSIVIVYRHFIDVVLFSLAIGNLQKTRQQVLRFWIATFLHGWLCIRRWGPKTMNESLPS